MSLKKLKKAVKKTVTAPVKKIAAEAKRLPANVAKNAGTIGAALQFVPGVGTIAGGAIAAVGSALKSKIPTGGPMEMITNVVSSTLSKSKDKSTDPMMLGGYMPGIDATGSSRGKKAVHLRIPNAMIQVGE